MAIFDLDDTLYPEKEFVYSGFQKVSEYVSKKFKLKKSDVFRFLLKNFEKGSRKKNFDVLIEKFKIEEDVKNLIQIYRNHKPKIHLYPDSRYALKKLKDKKIKIALITDGVPKVQSNKIKALDIEKIFDLIVINDLRKNIAKKDKKGFETIIKKLKVKPSECIFVGDNPEKDFVAANQMGFVSVRILRKEGIYKSLKNNARYPPDFTIKNMRYLNNILGGRI